MDLKGEDIFNQVKSLKEQFSEMMMYMSLIGDLLACNSKSAILEMEEGDRLMMDLLTNAHKSQEYQQIKNRYQGIIKVVFWFFNVIVEDKIWES